MLDIPVSVQVLCLGVTPSDVKDILSGTQGLGFGITPSDAHG